MKKLFFLLLVMTASFSASAQENEPKEIKLTNDERQLVENNNAFALRLFQKARGDESLLLSPLSITVDLGMLNNGADGINHQHAAFQQFKRVTVQRGRVCCVMVVKLCYKLFTQCRNLAAVAL